MNLESLYFYSYVQGKLVFLGFQMLQVKSLILFNLGLDKCLHYLTKRLKHISTPVASYVLVVSGRSKIIATVNSPVILSTVLTIMAHSFFIRSSLSLNWTLDASYILMIKEGNNNATYLCFFHSTIFNFPLNNFAYVYH